MSSKSIVETVGPGVGGRWEAHFKEGWGKFVDFVMFFFMHNVMSLPTKKFWPRIYFRFYFDLLILSYHAVFRNFILKC